jgi:glutamate dehydrogenase (NAD(P)+)
VVAVQDHRTTLFNPAGLDVPKLMEYASHSGTIDGFRAEVISTSSSGKSIATS